MAVQVSKEMTIGEILAINPGRLHRSRPVFLTHGRSVMPAATQWKSGRVMLCRSFGDILRSWTKI